MKAIFIFNQLNDIVFVHYDEAFRRHVITKAAQAGLAESGDFSQPLDPNVAMQLFSPLVASLRFMTEQVDNPYQSIKCENDFLFVMEQYHDHILLAINGDQLETEEFMHRKLLILQRLLRFFFGPCDEEIRLDKLPERDARWRFVARLVDTWVELYNTEQSFLIEAVERVHVNQLLNAKCVQLLEMVLNTVRTSGGEKAAVHALLTVNSKLLALFSVKTAYELLPSDLLLLLILARTKFPTHHKLEDFFSQSVTLPNTNPLPEQPDSQILPDSESENNEEDDLECFSSVPSTPGQSPERGPSPTADAHQHSSYESPSFSTEELAKQVQEQLKLIGEDPQKLLQMFYPPVAEKDQQSTGTKPHMVMLGTPVCKYTPHTVHCTEIMPGVILTILCEVSRSKMSGMICQTVSVLRAVLHKSAVSSLHGKQTIDFIDNNLKKVTDMSKKLKGGTALDRIITDICKKWDTSKKSGLLAYLDSREDTSIPSRLEATLTSVLERLKSLFRALYLNTRRTTSESQHSLNNSIEYCQTLLQRHLYDYKEYLAVKAQRNFTMTNFVEDFPGLIHFIYVDRVMHHMVAPSINVAADPTAPGKIDMMKVIKTKLWSKLPDIQRRLQNGHLTQVVRDGDFLYSYFLWFEDGSGHPVQIPNSYNGVRENMLPGILEGGFYRQLVRGVFPSSGPAQFSQLRGYELLMLHVSIVPTTVVLRQGRKLAAMMWETTGEANSPVTLL